MKVSYHQLLNGLTVVLLPLPANKSITSLFLCNTGSRYESKNKEGLAHFLEHMVFKGTEKFPNSKILAQQVDSIGADFNAFTSKEYTGYYVKSASEHLDKSLEVLSEMLLAPKLNSADIEREKGVIIEEINMYHDHPAQYVGNLFERMFFAGSGLEHDIIGSKETVSNFKKSDFEELLQQWYGFENIILVLAGDEEVLKTKPILELLNKKLDKGNWQARNRAKQDINKFLDAKLASKKIHLEYRDTQQAHFIMGWPGLKRGDKRRYAATLLTAILGGNMSSRLFTQVREQRGLAYYINSELDYYHDAGMIGAAAGVDPNRLEEAIKVTLAEFEKIVENQPVTEAELQMAKDYVAGKMTLSLEDSQSLAHFFGLRKLLENSQDTPELVLGKIKDVALEEVSQLARDLFLPGKLNLTMIGPEKNEDKFVSLLKI